jgi:hypothetical protein
MKPIAATTSARLARRAMAILTLAAATAPLCAARAQGYKYDFRVEGGGWVPTGTMANDLKAAGTVGLTAGLIFSPNWTALASAYWTPSEDKVVSGEMQVTIYQYDVGLEWSTKTSRIARWDIMPFLGAGLGSREYSPRRVTEPSQSAFDGYLSGGLAFAAEQATWRFGVRDYVSGWKGLMKTQSATGNDLAILAGVGFRF